MKRKLISADSLNQIFDQNKEPGTCTYRGKCGICGCLVQIEIDKTSGGYGLLGGILYETDPEGYIGICINCY
jgi:hypothetical protein